MIPSFTARCVDIVTCYRSYRNTVTNVLAGTVDPRSDESCSVNSNWGAQSETASPGVTRYFKVSITVFVIYGLVSEENGLFRLFTWCRM